MFEIFLLDSLIRIALAELSRESLLIAAIVVLLIAARLRMFGQR